MNAFRGIPTNEDIRRAYFWESRRLAAREAELYSTQKRKKRLESLWRATWYSSVQMSCSDGDRSTLIWKTSFAMVQGHRFLWWNSVKEFDDGLPPAGYVFLAGHAGLATPNPLEVRQMDEEQRTRMVCLFGRGVDKQERITMLTPNAESKAELERSISSALSHKQD